MVFFGYKIVLEYDWDNVLYMLYFYNMVGYLLEIFVIIIGINISK